MTTVYEIGGNGVWTGATREIGEADGLLGPWTRSPIPELAEGEYAEFDGVGWRIVTEAVFIAGRRERLKSAIVAATQSALDDFARTRGYDGILSACTYATDPNPVFSAEGQYCVTLRGQTWAALYQMLAEVEAGTRPIPSSFDDIAGELPTASAAWPQ